MIVARLIVLSMADNTTLHMQVGLLVLYCTPRPSHINQAYMAGTSHHVCSTTLWLAVNNTTVLAVHSSSIYFCRPMLLHCGELVTISRCDD